MADDLFRHAGIPLKGETSSLSVQSLTEEQAVKIIAMDEGQFSEVKSALISPSGLTKPISAFANTDGGDLYIGISEIGDKRDRKWEGFKDQEAANAHLQVFEKLFPLGTDFQYQFLRSDKHDGLILHVQVNKTRGIAVASNDLPDISAAGSLPAQVADMLKRL